MNVDFAKWLPTFQEGVFHCSKCGKIPSDYTGRIKYYTPEYCPTCGSYMWGAYWKQVGENIDRGKEKSNED